MPLWAYNIPIVLLALIMVAGIEAIALIGLVLVRRYLMPHRQFHDGVNDAVSGTVQAIGVFYGMTVGLIAAGVWTTYSNAGDLMSQEAVAIGSLYRDVSSLPEPARTKLRQNCTITRSQSSRKTGRLNVESRRATRDTHCRPASSDLDVV